MILWGVQRRGQPHGAAGLAPHPEPVDGWAVSLSTGKQHARTTPRKARNTRKSRKRSFCFVSFVVSCLSWLR